jgi:hypothetical protein
MSLKLKNRVLVIGMVLLFWLGYLFSFSKVFEARKQYRLLQKKQIYFSNVSQKLILLKRQNAVFDSILASKKIVSESSFQNTLLKTITVIADSSALKIISFNKPHIFKTENSMVSTYSFSLQGSFSKITELIYQLEQQSKLGEVISVQYRKKKNYRRNFYFLECTIFLQHVDSY